MTRQKNSKFSVTNQKILFTKSKEKIKRIKRKDPELHVIAHFDMPGSTALKFKSQRNGITKALTHNEFCKKLIETGPYKGQVIKELGDAVLAIFSNAGIACACALNVISNLKKYGCGIHTKVAISTGLVEIIPREQKDVKNKMQKINDVFGSAVDFCARLSSTASENTISIPVYLKEQVDIVLQDIPNAKITKKFNPGLRNFKNVEVCKVILK